MGTCRSSPAGLQVGVVAHQGGISAEDGVNISHTFKYTTTSYIKMYGRTSDEKYAWKN
jgi:hypothetical protein